MLIQPSRFPGVMLGIAVFLYTQPEAKALTVSAPKGASVIDAQFLGALPTGCHAIRRIRPTFREPHPPYSAYDHIATFASYDIACIGRNIRVRRPLRTGGGDVYFLADTVELEAPIDTRPYYPRNFAKSFVAPSEWKQFTGPQAYVNSGTRNAFDMLGKSKAPHRNLFRQYYEDCLDCDKGPGGQMWAAEVPSGLTPAFLSGYVLRQDEFLVEWRRNGLAPPDDRFSEAAVQSGSITIVANTFRISDTLPAGRPAGRLMACASRNESREPGVAYVLNASGARGGRGGAGTPDPCTAGCGYEEQGNYGGDSGPGGRGGNAGDISIRLFNVNQHQLTDVQRLVRKYASVAGGSPGSNERYRSPAIHYVTKGDNCEFGRRTPWPASEKGNDGNLEVVSIESEAAVASLLSQLRVRDLDPSYDFGELAERAQNDPTITSISFEDFVATRLSGLAAEAQTQLTYDVSKWLVGSGKTTEADKSASYLPLWGTHISDISIRSSVSPRLQGTLLSVGQLSPVRGRNALDAYLIRTGGVANITRTDIVKEVQADLQITELQFGAEIWSGIRADLERVNRSIGDLKEALLTQAVENRLAALDEQVRAAESVSANVDGMDTALTKLDAFGKKSSEVQRRYRTLRSINPSEAADEAAFRKMDEAQFNAFVELLPAVGSAVSAGKVVLAVLGGSNSKKNRILVETIRTKIQQAESDLEAIVSAAEKARFLSSEHERRRLVEALRNRLNGSSRLDVRTALFDDLLRYSIFTYSKQGITSDMEINLQNIREYVAKSRLAQAFRFGQPVTSCEGVNTPWLLMGLWKVEGRCLYVKPRKRYMALFGTVGTLSNSTPRPIYIVKPSDEAIVLPTFGYHILSEQIFLNEEQ